MDAFSWKQTLIHGRNPAEHSKKKWDSNDGTAPSIDGYCWPPNANTKRQPKERKGRRIWAFTSNIYPRTWTCVLLCCSIQSQSRIDPHWWLIYRHRVAGLPHFVPVSFWPEQPKMKMQSKSKYRRTRFPFDRFHFGGKKRPNRYLRSWVGQTFHKLLPRTSTLAANFHPTDRNVVVLNGRHSLLLQRLLFEMFRGNSIKFYILMNCREFCEQLSSVLMKIVAFKSASIHFASWNNSPLEIFNKLHLCTWVQWTSTWLHGSLNVFIKVFWIRSGRIKRSVANCVQDLPACTTPNYSGNLFVMMWLLAVTRCTSHVAAGKWKAYVDQGNFVRTQTAERSEMNRRPPRTRRFDLFIFKKRNWFNWNEIILIGVVSRQSINFFVIKLKSSDLPDQVWRPAPQEDAARPLVSMLLANCCSISGVI